MKRQKNRIILVLGSALFLYALYHLLLIHWDYRDAEDAYQIIRDSAVQIRSMEKTQTNGANKETVPWYEAVKIDFDALAKMNQDIIAWIHFDQNEIDYPVLHTDNNSTYLHKMADGTENNSGSIFVESACNGSFDESYTIIYGHNRKDLSMFGCLKKYKAEDSYYEVHKNFSIFTPEKAYRYEIFSYYDTEENDTEIYRVGFGADDTFLDMISRMQKRSYRSTNVSVDKEDSVITLSTCSEEGKRFVVHAVCVDNHEDTVYNVGKDKKE